MDGVRALSEEVMSLNTDMHGARGETPDGEDGSPSAARLLEMTARETDRWRSEARDESAAIVQAARDEAERLVAAARKEAEQTTNDARVEAYRVRESTTRLEQVETDTRERLRQHLTDMLAQVDATSPDAGQ